AEPSRRARGRAEKCARAEGSSGKKSGRDATSCRRVALPSAPFSGSARLPRVVFEGSARDLWQADMFRFSRRKRSQTLPSGRGRWPTLTFSPRSVLVLFAAVVATSLAGFAIVTNLSLVQTLHDPAAHHMDQARLLSLVQGGHGHQAFEAAFEAGDS